MLKAGLPAKHPAILHAAVHGNLPQLLIPVLTVEDETYGLYTFNSLNVTKNTVGLVNLPSLFLVFHTFHTY
jgi:hypothetical protein